MPLYSTSDFQPLWANLCKPPLHFGRRPPQSNYPPDIVPLEDNSSWLATRIKKSGISTTAHNKLASVTQSLPPILHVFIQAAVSSYSKGPRGLSVLPRVGGIFTSTTISLDPSLRQLPSRYAIHAGRYLTDKEFRYLRTVIVTAAVYSGFDQMLRLRWHHQLTFEHRAGVTPYTSNCLLAECCVYGKQSGGTLCCNLLCLRSKSFTKLGTPYTEDTVLFCRVP